MKTNGKWQLKDIIMIAIFGVIFALIYLAVLYIGLAVQAALTPAGLGIFAFEIFYGIWFMGATLAAYVIQKPGVAVTTEVLASFLEFLMGNVGGPLVLIAGAVQGLGSEVGFMMFRYRRFDMLSICASGMLAAVFSFLWGFVQGGYALFAPGLLVAMLAVRIASALLFAGVISKVVGDGLARAGVLKSYALGVKFSAVELPEE